eukprot:scaffold35852_cov25-Prasinocladus_malaysianus.AAC.2
MSRSTAAGEIAGDVNEFVAQKARMLLLPDIQACNEEYFCSDKRIRRGHNNILGEALLAVVAQAIGGSSRHKL